MGSSCFGTVPFIRKQFIEPAKAKLRSWPKWVLPTAALSAGVALLFACAILAAIGGSLAWKGLWGADTATVAVSEDDRHLPPSSTPAPTPTPAQDAAEPVSPLPSPTPERDIARSISPLPSPTATPEEEDSGVDKDILDSLTKK